MASTAPIRSSRANPSIRAAAAHDSPGFLEGELERRRQLEYPPYSNLVRITLACEDETRLEQAAALVAERLAGVLPRDSSLLGPAPMFRARGRFRRRLLIKSAHREQAIEAVHTELEAVLSEHLLRGIVLSVDVDPQ